MLVLSSGGRAEFSLYPTRGAKAPKNEERDLRDGPFSCVHKLLGQRALRQVVSADRPILAPLGLRSRPFWGGSRVRVCGVVPDPRSRLIRCTTRMLVWSPPATSPSSAVITTFAVRTDALAGADRWYV